MSGSLTSVPVVSLLIFCLLVWAVDNTDSSPADCRTLPADIMWLLDKSTSLTEVEFTKIKDFAKRFTQDFVISPDGPNMGAATFATNAASAFDLNQHFNTADVIDAINNISSKKPGLTHTYKGLEFIHTTAFTKAHGDREDIPNILIVVTDGVSDNSTRTAEEARKIHEKNITVLTVGIGFLSGGELPKIASQRQGIFHVTDVDGLGNLVGNITGAVCEAITPPTLPPPTPAAITPPTLPPPTPAVQHCDYKGKQYSQGAQWQDGCAYACECVDGATGRYQCYNKCPTYLFLPPHCTLVQLPGLCCLQPVCDFGAIYHQTTGGQNVRQLNEYQVCVYKGSKYYQGQRWTVGCDTECFCYDAGSGLYTCHSKCAQYGMLPSNCRLVKKPDECCAKPECQFHTTMGPFTGVGQPSGNGQSVHTVFTF